MGKCWWEKENDKKVLWKLDTRENQKEEIIKITNKGEESY